MYVIKTNTQSKHSRILETVIGDIKKDAYARVKYGYLFGALAHRFPLLTVQDAYLHWCIE